MNELTLRTFPLPVTQPLQHEDGVHLATFSPDGRHILTASRNNQTGFGMLNPRGRSRRH